MVFGSPSSTDCSLGADNGEQATQFSFSSRVMIFDKGANSLNHTPVNYTKLGVSRQGALRLHSFSTSFFSGHAGQGYFSNQYRSLAITTTMAICYVGDYYYNYSIWMEEESMSCRNSQGLKIE